VLTAPTGLGPGTRIVLQTADGRQRFTVSGVIRTGAQAAFYATGSVAARLAGGRIDAVALTGPPGEPVAALAVQARAAARGQPVRVLTGDHRRDAEPDPDGDLFAVAASLLGTTSGLAGFVSVFVVASTFAYAVAARRREMRECANARADRRDSRACPIIGAANPRSRSREACSPGGESTSPPRDSIRRAGKSILRPAKPLFAPSKATSPKENRILPETMSDFGSAKSDRQAGGPMFGAAK